MGRFVQENFLSPQIVERSLKMPTSVCVGQWLANPQNNQQVVQMIQHTVPKIFEFVSQDQIAHFVQNNSVQWVRSTKINKLASEMLRAVWKMTSIRMCYNVVLIWPINGLSRILNRHATYHVNCFRNWVFGNLPKAQAGLALMCSNGPLTH